jgi:hypothetical protein
VNISLIMVISENTKICSYCVGFFASYELPAQHVISVPVLHPLYNNMICLAPG